jgi:hypothetical protein
LYPAPYACARGIAGTQGRPRARPSAPAPVPTRVFPWPCLLTYVRHRTPVCARFAAGPCRAAARSASAPPGAASLAGDRRTRLRLRPRSPGSSPRTQPSGSGSASSSASSGSSSAASGRRRSPNCQPPPCEAFSSAQLGRRERPQRIRHLVWLPDRHELPPALLYVGGSLRQPGKGPTRKVSSLRKVALPHSELSSSGCASPPILRGSRERPPGGFMRPAGTQFAAWARRKTAPWRGNQGHGHGDLPWSHASGGRRVEPLGGVDRTVRGEESKHSHLWRPISNPISFQSDRGIWDRASLGAAGMARENPLGLQPILRFPRQDASQRGPSRHPPGSEAPELGCPTSRDEGKGMGGSP